MISGWEFLILNPFDKHVSQSSQNLYNKNYNDSYYKFVQELCIPNPKELFDENENENENENVNNNLFTFYILCGGNSDKIELENKFEITFNSPPIKEFEFLINKYFSIDEVRIALFDPKEEQIKYYSTILNNLK
jgi:hypothetical protein